MRQANRRGNGWAIAVSLGAHALVLTLLLTHRWSLDLPAEQPDSPWEHIMTVDLAPRPAVLLSRPPRAGETPLPSAPATAVAAPPAAQTAPTGPTALAQGAGGDGAGRDLGTILRRGVLGCANLERLTRAEREGCEDTLGAGAKHDTVLALAMDPRIRAYYDAVAKAKAPDKPLTPIRATGALGVFDSANYGTTGHPPGIECHLSFGKGPKKRLPSHWLKLGPCAIAPPQGPLTVEADITPPDQDLSHPPPRSGPQRPPGVRHEIAVGAPASRPTLERDDGKDADGETPPR